MSLEKDYSVFVTIDLHIPSIFGLNKCIRVNHFIVEICEKYLSMRIIIDFQAAQSISSRNRGIGRYSLSLALSMARCCDKHEVLIVLNDLFPETIQPLRDAFGSILPQENIRVWSSVSSVSYLGPENEWRRQAAAYMREAFLASLEPDIVYVSSLFEGYEDDAITSIGLLTRDIPTAVTLYDLIPYLHRDSYLHEPKVRSWYFEKIENLCRADLWLAISESSREEGIENLNLPQSRTVSISTDADPTLDPVRLPKIKSISCERSINSAALLLCTRGA